MTNDPTTSPPRARDAARGYLSEEHKRKFTITAGVLGAVFFIAQFILPAVMMMAMMPAMMFRSDWLRQADLRGAAYWDGAVWYVEESLGFEQRGNPRLKKLVVGSEEEPVEMEELPLRGSDLLAGEDRLWLISSSAVGSYQNGKFALEPTARQLGDISRPFLHEGRPAAVEQTPAHLALLVFTVKDGWQEQMKLAVPDEAEATTLAQDLQVISDRGTFHVFWRFGQTLYYREGLPVSDADGAESWIPVSPVGYQWNAMLLDGLPTVFVSRMSEGPSATVSGLRLRAGKWDEFFSHESLMVTELAALPLGSEGTFVLAMESFPGSMRVVEARGSAVVRETRHGSGFPFFRWMPAAMIIPHVGTTIMPLILAFILSASMRKHRVVEFRSGDSSMPFASLARRAISQLIDAVILSGPILVSGIVMMQGVFDLEDMLGRSGLSGFVHVLGLILAGLAWLLLCFLVFAILEGKYGITPGKWVTGIRVLGTDLKPCGFVRALIRNVLKVVDGFFNFMVGILVAALSDDWQRVGDMAARTVVVDVRRGQSEASRLGGLAELGGGPQMPGEEEQ